MALPWWFAFKEMLNPSAKCVNDTLLVMSTNDPRGNVSFHSGFIFFPLHVHSAPVLPWIHFVGGVNLIYSFFHLYWVSMRSSSKKTFSVQNLKTHLRIILDASP